MADSARAAQATVLEIPVTIQGAKNVEGTDRREIFAETTKTTIVFGNGAVLKLKAKVLPGQCVFLRNELTGKEILCRVLESRQAGEAGYTDLEFTAHNPEFWEAPAERPAATVTKAEAAGPKAEVAGPKAEVAATKFEAAGPKFETVVTKPEAQESIEAAEIPVAQLAQQSEEWCVPAVDEMPGASQKIELMSAAEPAPEKPEIAAKAEAAPEADWDEAKDAELAAALSAMEAGAKAQRETFAKETTKETARETAKEIKVTAHEATSQAVARADARETDETEAERAREIEVISTRPSAIGKIRELMAGKNPIAIGIAASVLMAAVLGVAWQAKSALSTHASNPAFAGSAPVGAHAVGATAPTPAAAASAAAPGVAAMKSGAAAAADVRGASGSKAAVDTAAPADPLKRATVDTGGIDGTAPGEATHRRPNGMHAGETIPAKILSQAPPSIPPWAKDLDMDRVVTLDAVIDEKGNVVETKPLSGPRLLQAAAERAVALWIFEPALSNGKPTTTHMVLTVQFQK